MGNQLFGIDLAGIIADAIGPGVFDVTISREQQGQRDPDNPTGGLISVEPLTFECKGFWEDLTGMPPPGVVIELNDRKLVLIGDTIPAGGIPQRGDKATVHEDMGDLSQYVVQMLRRDAAGAVYEFLCRDRGVPVA